MVVDLIITTVIDYQFRSKVYDFVKNESQTNTMKKIVSLYQKIFKKNMTFLKSLLTQLVGCGFINHLKNYY